MEMVPFFSDEIKIRVHSATKKEHVSKVMTIREFAGESSVALYKSCDDLVVYKGSMSGPFIQGVEI